MKSEEFLDAFSGIEYKKYIFGGPTYVSEDAILIYCGNQFINHYVTSNCKK